MHDDDNDDNSALMDTARALIEAVGSGSPFGPSPTPLETEALAAALIQLAAGFSNDLTLAENTVEGSHALFAGNDFSPDSFLRHGHFYRDRRKYLAVKEKRARTALTRVKAKADQAIRDAEKKIENIHRERNVIALAIILGGIDKRLSAIAKTKMAWPLLSALTPETGSIPDATDERLKAALKVAAKNGSNPALLDSIRATFMEGVENYTREISRPF